MNKANRAAPRIRIRPILILWWLVHQEEAAMRLTVVFTLALAIFMGTDARAGDRAQAQTENVYINVNGLG